MLKRFMGKAVIALTFTNLFLGCHLGLFSQRAIAGELDNPSTSISVSATDLGKPLTMNCRVAMLTLKEFFFVEQDGKQVAGDCLSIVQPTEQNSSIGGEQYLKPGESLTLPPIEIPLERPEVQSDRLLLFQTPL